MKTGILRRMAVFFSVLLTYTKLTHTYSTCASVLDKFFIRWHTLAKSSRCDRAFRIVYSCEQVIGKVRSECKGPVTPWRFSQRMPDVWKIWLKRWHTSNTLWVSLHTLRARWHTSYAGIRRSTLAYVVVRRARRQIFHAWNFATYASVWLTRSAYAGHKL